jgi:hypothetical protein
MKNPMPLSPLRTAVALCGALALSACERLPAPPSPPRGGARAGVVAPSLGLFSKIKVPDDREPALKLAARGAQVFRCEKRDGRPQRRQGHRVLHSCVSIRLIRTQRIHALQD